MHFKLSSMMLINAVAIYYLAETIFIFTIKKWEFCLYANEDKQVHEKKFAYQVSRSQFYSLLKGKKVGKFNRIMHVQPSIFCKLLKDFAIMESCLYR